MPDQSEIEQLLSGVLSSIVAAARMHCQSASTAGRALKLAGELAQAALYPIDPKRIEALEVELTKLAEEEPA